MTISNTLPTESATAETTTEFEKHNQIQNWHATLQFYTTTQMATDLSHHASLHVALQNNNT